MTSTAYDNVTYMLTEHDVPQQPTTLATSVGATVMLIFFIGGMLGNIWILVAIATKRNMWTVINTFIASLLVNDVLSLCLIVVLIIDSYIWKEWTAGEIMCKLNPEFTVAFIGSSLWHTALIAIHRYIVVVHNNVYSRMKKEVYVIFVLVMARGIPIACTVPGFNLKTSGYMPKMLRCILLPTQQARIISVTIVQIILPSVIVVLCYALIFGYVYKITRQLQDTNIVLRREMQITKMFGVIFLNILLGFVPYTVLRNADRDNNIHADVYVVVAVFYAMAICSSPLVYGIMSRDIRNACSTLIRNLASTWSCCQISRHSQTWRPQTEIGETQTSMVTRDTNTDAFTQDESENVPDSTVKLPTYRRDEENFDL